MMRLLQHHVMTPIPRKDSVRTPKKAVERIVLQPNVVDSLFQQLHLPARVCGGLLFGHHEGHELHIVLASSAGSPEWYAQPTRSVLAVDTRFALGWAEAVSAVWGGHVDWCGNWTIHPTTQWPSDKWAREQFATGHQQGLFDEFHLLLLAGWRDGSAEFLAYLEDHNGNPATVPVSLGAGSPASLPAPFTP
ncbi:hypothetical protein [Deinococcus arcticus]|uniref:JAB domain-containing protein n=1 Tax=Deinococcus arcticus TaxID=2136176 RepID=A0A2T3W3F3_9DEIO|nr:hypothetical protein [Deinococcus arcticus]PTA66334.1 hypothetical protein C8263_18500 [Deinococcus arcticus]